jgi:hypothetical protein
MTTIIPAWIRKRDDTGVWAILGSEPPSDAQEQFIEIELIENVVESEHEMNGRRFSIIMAKDFPRKTHREDTEQT